MNTQEQRKESAQNSAKKLCAELKNYIEHHNIPKGKLAEAIGMPQQNISSNLSGRRMIRISTLFLLLEGIEAVTGHSFERPTFTKIKPKSNVK